jgi:hypothetical protein
MINIDLIINYYYFSTTPIYKIVLNFDHGDRVNVYEVTIRFLMIF